MTGFAAACGFEWLKLRRSAVTWTATAVLVLAVPGLSTGLLAAAGSDSGSPLAAKTRPLVTQSGWEGHFSVTGQITGVAALVVIGMVTCWAFGREFTDRTVGALAALPVSTGRIAAAKFTVLAGWAFATIAATAVATAVAGTFANSGVPSAQAWNILAKLTIGAALIAVLCAPLALAASLGRGHLTGIAVLFGILVAAQIASVAGLGGWFPYSAPSLWLGIGGTQAAQHISTQQLLLPLPVSATATAVTIAWWRRRAAR